MMTSLRRALLFGFLVWLVPFVAAFVIFPLRESSRPLFESIMPVVIAITVVALGVTYFRRATGGYVREGVALGVLWLAICVIIDLPLMLLGGPMQMTVREYIADIGVTYLLIPVLTVGMGVALTSVKPESPE